MEQKFVGGEIDILHVYIFEGNERVLLENLFEFFILHNMHRQDFKINVV